MNTRSFRRLQEKVIYGTGQDKLENIKEAQKKEVSIDLIQNLSRSRKETWKTVSAADRDAYKAFMAGAKLVTN